MVKISGRLRIRVRASFMLSCSHFRNFAFYICPNMREYRVILFTVVQFCGNDVALTESSRRRAILMRAPATQQYSESILFASK